MTTKTKPPIGLAPHAKEWADMHVGQSTVVLLGENRVHAGRINGYKVGADGKVLFDVDGEMVSLGSPPPSPEEQAAAPEIIARIIRDLTPAPDVWRPEQEDEGSPKDS